MRPRVLRAIHAPGRNLGKVELTLRTLIFHAKMDAYLGADT
jgi:hypothetical protein